MIQRILSYLAFFVLMSLSIAVSIPIVFLLYLPFVALKAVVLGITGKMRPNVTNAGASQPAGH